MNIAEVLHINNPEIRHFYISFIKFSMIFVALMLVLVLSLLSLNTYYDSRRELIHALDQSALEKVTELKGGSTVAQYGMQSLFQEYNFFEQEGALAHIESNDASVQDESEPSSVYEVPSTLDALRGVQTRSYIATTICTIDNMGNFEILQNALGIDPQELQILMKHLAVQDRFDVTKVQQGHMVSSKMYYSVQPLSDGRGVIAVASAQYITDTLIRSIRADIVIMIVGLISFFLLSIILASYATRPLRQAWEDQRRFISDVSHELKTPLAVIKANMSIMSAHRSDSFQENERWITSTQDVVERMNSLVEDMLQLSRHRKRNSHEYIICNLGELAEKSALQFESRAFEQGITIKTYIDKSIGITGDEAELLRLITIFVDNACKYAYTNTEVSLTVKRISSQKALVSIHNMGAPIPERDLPHIFERFYRVNKERERETGSWGLGLPIAQNIITAYKGNIIVSSDTEDGTTFTLYLPTFDL